MTDNGPMAVLDPTFSSPGAAPASWAEAERRLAEAEVYWLSTVRPDGRPHVTPVIGVWLPGALYFCTGPDERKARNLDGNAHCVMTTGCNVLNQGLDLTVEGDAVRVTDEGLLERLAEAYVAKYGDDWRFAVRDGAFAHEAGIAHVFEVAPRRAFGFGKGEPYSQTRWRFQGHDA